LTNELNQAHGFGDEGIRNIVAENNWIGVEDDFDSSSDSKDHKGNDNFNNKIENKNN